MPKSKQREIAVAAALARYYDLDVSEQYDDVEMYLALAAASEGAILELACGSGRICVPLAEAGHHVTGVDRDPAMLDRARSAWAGSRKSTGADGTLDLVRADITSVTMNERFGLVILAFNGLLLLPDRSAQEKVVSNVAAHVASDGRAVIDIWLPAPEDLVLYDGRLMNEWIREEPSTGNRVSKTTSARYSPASARATVDTHFDEWRQMEAPTRTHRRDEISFLSARGLISLIERAGLEPQIIAGDYDMTEFGTDSDRLVLVARLAGRL